MLLQSHLQRDRHAAGFVVVRGVGLDRRDQQPAIAVDLAAVRSKPHLGQPRIAGDDLEVQPEQRDQHLGVHRRARRRSGGAERDLPALQVVDRLDRFVPDAAGRDFRVEAAEPVELARVELAALRIDQRLDGVDRVRHADGEAVARRHGGEIAGRLQRAGARHVLDDDVRVARHVPRQVLGEQPQIKLEGRAGRIADHRLDGLAAIERGERPAPAPRLGSTPAPQLKAETRSATGMTFVMLIAP